MILRQQACFPDTAGTHLSQKWPQSVCCRFDCRSELRCPSSILIQMALPAQENPTVAPQQQLQELATLGQTGNPRTHFGDSSSCPKQQTQTTFHRISAWIIDAPLGQAAHFSLGAILSQQNHMCKEEEMCKITNLYRLIFALMAPTSNKETMTNVLIHEVRNVRPC